MLDFDVNWLAILVAVVANMVIGAVWYGALAKPWLEGIGKTREDIQGNQTVPYVIAIVNSLVMALVLARVISWAAIDDLAGGLLAGLLMWVGFTGFTFASNHAFEGRSITLWAINSGTYLVGLLVMGGIFALWQ
jgi:hypothetical protein